MSHSKVNPQYSKKNTPRKEIELEYKKTLKKYKKNQRITTKKQTNKPYITFLIK